MRKTIYISIPSTGSNSVTESEKAQKHYERLGFEVYNPIKLLSQFQIMCNKELSEFQQLTFTLDYLSKADIMVLFPDHPGSFKCTTEIVLANRYKIPIIQVYSGNIMPYKSLHKCLSNFILKPAEVLLLSTIHEN